MDSHCQATEEKLDALICWRELQISFALQMLASSGKYPHLRILNFGRLNFCDGTAATFFSHNPFFISCCYYILHFVTAVYFNFFQVSSITSKAIQNRNHATRWQWWWSSTRPRRWKQALHAITFLNVDHDLQFCCILQWWNIA